MPDEIKKLMDEEIKRELEDLSKLKPTDDGYTEATDRLAKLYKVRADEKYGDCEALLKEQQFNADVQQKEKQANDANLERWIKLGLDAAGILLPLWFYSVWMNQGLKFEETGSFTSNTFKGLINRFRPIK